MSDWTVTYMFADMHLIGFDDVEVDVESIGGAASTDGEGNVFLTMHVSAATADAAQTAATGDLRGVGISVEPAIAVETLMFEEYERRANRPTLPVLVGAAEVGEMLGVTRQRVHQLSRLRRFPAPLVRVRMGLLWDERAIARFEREWNRKPGRPPETVERDAAVV
ncbi:MAG: hypothetical protein WC054_12560 [Candidatus Nanopelagicales bacterium]